MSILALGKDSLKEENCVDKGKKVETLVVTEKWSRLASLLRVFIIITVEKKVAQIHLKSCERKF